MRTSGRIAGLAIAVTAALGGIIVTGAAAAAPVAPTAVKGLHACANVPGTAHCYAVAMPATAANRVHPDASSPSGYFPADLQAAYALPSATAGAGRTVAIVDAYDDPTAEADLGVYRAQFGLPPCTTANGCFRKIDQNGGTHYPRKNGGWAQEISLDLDMVSAICPNCRILLVEAKTNSFTNLGAAVNQAAAKHAFAISNSYGGSDSSDASAPFYNHPGIVVTASTGDAGFGVEFPASSHFVTAVGGTHLVRASNSRGWSETVWSGAGSGCSTLNASLAGQASFDTGCAGRALADVSAVADPATGVAVYDSTAFQGLSGWLVFGGTSVSSPIIASVFALAGNSGGDNNYPYSHYSTSNFNDVTSGSNGSRCTPSQLCTARVGWDGPTGLGTPNGIGGF